ncbi:MAG: GNAT family N-acetyltransferase [Actinomycetota bacterium]
MTHDAPRHRSGEPSPRELPIGLPVLRGNGITCRVRSWPGRPNIAQLVLYHQSSLPSITDLDRWSTQLSGLGFDRVRTTAMTETSGIRMEAAGFRSVQELVLLQFDDPRRIPIHHSTVRRLDASGHREAAAVDAAAFDEEWALDERSIADVRAATPRHRARMSLEPGRTEPMVAYAVSGRDARQGFLQRLAVRPDAQRRGLGRALVLDSLRWAARWRVDRVLVNTHTTNVAALSLYEGLGFRRLPERLYVFERSLEWSDR